LIETHAHADHLSAAPYIQEKLGGKLGIGEDIKIVQEIFRKIFNEGTEFQRNGSQFDRLFKDGDTYQIGSMTAFAMLTPGHTPACMTHVIGNAAFVGDTLFMPDAGTARRFSGRQCTRSVPLYKTCARASSRDEVVHVP
jgi:glyoxylase-like metal-dependent hydrolase (beta-lactamase superfamily II)